MRPGQRWRGARRAVLAGSATAACVALTAVPAQLAAASQRRAGPAAAVVHICSAWLHGGQKRTALADKLSSDIQTALHGRAGTHFDSASVVKATILAGLMRKAEAQPRSLTDNEKSLATLMITQSNNTAATKLWNDTGRYRLQRFLDLAGMGQTVLGPGGYWG